MDLDRQSIERRDFPIGRRGYDTAAVDGHLRALASAIEELQRAAVTPGPDSLAANAGAQVQGIVAAAEHAAAEIESEARASAESMREQAESAAAKIRADAIAQAQAHVAAVSRASATLLARVESMDGQVDALVQSLRAGASDLAGDLAAVQTNMGELYDAAAGRRSREAGGSSEGALPQPDEPAEPAPPEPSGLTAPIVSKAPAAKPTPAAAGAVTATGPAREPPVAGEAAGGSDYDARLVALNMALNGDTREAADRYIAANYEVADRQKLLDEVFAAIES